MAVPPVRGSRGGGDAQVRAGAVSHRQQAMRIAINIGSSRLGPSASKLLAEPLFRISVSKSRLTPAGSAIAGIWLAICALAGGGGIDLANVAG